MKPAGNKCCENTKHRVKINNQTKPHKTLPLHSELQLIEKWKTLPVNAKQSSVVQKEERILSVHNTQVLETSTSKLILVTKRAAEVGGPISTKR